MNKVGITKKDPVPRCTHALCYPMPWHTHANKTQCSDKGFIEIDGVNFCRKHAGKILLDDALGVAHRTIAVDANGFRIPEGFVDAVTKRDLPEQPDIPRNAKLDRKKFSGIVNSIAHGIKEEGDA